MGSEMCIRDSYYMVTPPDKYSMVVPGDCSGTDYPEERCLFVHPWMDDDDDLSKIQLVRGDVFVKARIRYYLLCLLIGIVMSISLFYLACCRSKTVKQKVQ